MSNVHSGDGLSASRPTEGERGAEEQDRAVPVGGPAMEGPPASEVPSGVRTSPPPPPPPPAPSPVVPALVGAGVFALVAWVLWRLRLRRRPPTPAERLAEATHTLGDASTRFAGRALHRLSDVAEPAAERTASLARRGLHAGAEGAGELAGVAAGVGLVAGAKAADVGLKAGAKAADVGMRAGSKAAEVGHRVGSELVEVPEAVVGAVEDAYRTWRKWMRRLVLAVITAIGYVLGARAGRQRYEQIVGYARKLSG